MLLRVQRVDMPGSFTALCTTTVQDALSSDSPPVHVWDIRAFTRVRDIRLYVRGHLPTCPRGPPCSQGLSAWSDLYVKCIPLQGPGRDFSLHTSICVRCSDCAFVSYLRAPRAHCSPPRLWYRSAAVGPAGDQKPWGRHLSPSLWSMAILRRFTTRCGSIDFGHVFVRGAVSLCGQREEGVAARML